MSRMKTFLESFPAGRMNGRGNTVRKDYIDKDRYLFDQLLAEWHPGWESFDTGDDAWYYGFWVNKELRMTFSYVEGDLYWVQCPSAGHFNLEIAHACNFYQRTPGLVAISPTGEMEEWYQDRRAFFIPLLGMKQAA